MRITSLAQSGDGITYMTHRLNNIGKTLFSSLILNQKGFKLVSWIL